MRGWDDFGLTANFFEKKNEHRKKLHRGYYTVARRYEFYFRVENNILRKSAASE